MRILVQECDCCYKPAVQTIGQNVSTTRLIWHRCEDHRVLDLKVLDKYVKVVEERAGH